LRIPKFGVAVLPDAIKPTPRRSDSHFPAGSSDMSSAAETEHEVRGDSLASSLIAIGQGG